MKYYNQKIVWVTGASSGIGEALAYELAKHDAILILSARRKEELERVQEKCLQMTAQCYVYPLDLTLGEQILEVAQKVIHRFGRVDILINNGGMSMRALAHEANLSVDRKIMEVNFFGQIALTKAVLPSMIAYGSGHLVAVSSLTGKFGFPLRSAYAASKHALAGYFETLGLELSHKNIKSTVVFPGRINTNISLYALTKDGSPHGKMDKGQKKGIPADKCARKMLKGISRQKREIIIAGEEMLLVFFKRFIPPLFYMIASRVDPY